MSEFFTVFQFSLSVTGPIFAILALGVALKRLDMLDDRFVETGSRLVFTVTLPVLLFLSISKTRIGETTNFDLVGFGIGATLLAWLILERIAFFAVTAPEDRGVVVQGGFRSNMGIIGLAYCVNAWGEPGLVAASLYLGLVTILFNVLSVITLGRSLQRQPGFGRILRGIARNPLIIGILFALPFSWSGIGLPSILEKSAKHVADLTLPLALLCTGAALDFRSLQQDLASTCLAAGAKLIFVPLLFTLGGALMGFRGMDIGILLLMSSAPTAAASYVMVRAMGGNAPLAANIVALTTLGSLLTTSIGIIALKALQWM